MERPVILHIESPLGNLEIPELFSRIDVIQDAPPIEHHIVEKGLVYAPSYAVPPMYSIADLQFWSEWIDLYTTDPKSPREYLDKLQEIRESRKPVRFIIESDEYTTYPVNFPALINLRQYSIVNGEEHDIHYALDIFKFEEHAMKELDVEISGGEVVVREPESPRIDERPPHPRTHVVVSGDNLTRIARQFGQPDAAWRELYTLNKEIIHARGNQNLIFPGQEFIVPENWL
ncbi:MAG: LysM peptidoglycan-binding domain-containing protein [Defluviitaleaceae bacterium]|nr:LysM peptidoglycan-binding domain-containing protein [Defluviitaleaceae bacterium]